MLNEQAILACIEQTMVADAKVIKQAEAQLFEFQKESGFTFFLLKVLSNAEIPLNIRMSSAIYFKNKVHRSWYALDNDRKMNPDDIGMDEQKMIKDNLVEILVTNVESNHIRPHLTEAIHYIFYTSKDWDLTQPVQELLDSGKQEYIYAGLLLTFEFCKVHRYDMVDSRGPIDAFISVVFPIIENMLSGLVNASDYKSSELLYLILKSFKYACLNNFPAYFNQVEKLNSWIQLHLFVCFKPQPKEVLELDPSDRSLDKRVKVSKWGFGNLNRFIHKYSRTTKSISEEFVNYVLQNITPTIVQKYFEIIQSWGTGQFWLSDSSLYYLIQFLEKCMITDQLYPLIEPHLATIVENVIFTCLCANEQSVELLEDDPEDYTRRYYDFNKEGSTADVAAGDFIFVIGHRRPEQLSTILPFVNNIFTSFKDNANDLAVAYKQEGAMRIIASLFTFFENSGNELEGIFTHYIADLLAQEKYPFLVARALETVANYQNPINDVDTLSKVYDLSYRHLINESNLLPVRIEAADSLKSLIILNTGIHSHIAGQVPGIMENLLKLSKIFEIDILSEVMESFVERFADELTPFAKDLAHNLMEQYFNLSRVMIENNSNSKDMYSTGDQDQEIQASSILQTMTTMVMSMTKVSLIDEFSQVCKYGIMNAQISLMTELVDLMDSLALSSRMLHNGKIQPQIWELFHDVIDSFQTYAMDYFDNYTVFFETMITFGFPQDQTYIESFLTVLSVKLESDIDYDIDNVLTLLTMFSLSMKDIPLFDKAIQLIKNKDEIEFDEKTMIKLLVSNLIIKPVETLTLCENAGVTLEVLTMWFELKMTSVFAIKLQILAITSMMKLETLPSCINGFIGQFSNKLVDLLMELPNAIRKRDIMNKGEEGLEDGSTINEFNDPEEEEEYFEDFEDDFKETPLDSVNVFESITVFFHELGNTNATRYEEIIKSLNDEKKESLHTILQFVSQQSN
ncbi:hypothetical protein KAFR_0E03560 [Kazachstania africana CBS 2517]|uniref:Importin N-terminal domain-containing protein n=1 Tax=Kazachstania africana (strain ATCC 22294 / BCRC 22015 / CBS 2517 / CECT 1963 / NBRC 1671 / NRRL Y-8276) TaxID=1071382 RepID=H2AVV7_KAZAF|nr:hypothetical protein KAFR_0E03560 [Kazachstania africana CBS 2517]CCF58507.1 hypothetical protein KAFR_0E03560 [Kazachstania africana CBS 2517]